MNAAKQNAVAMMVRNGKIEEAVKICLMCNLERGNGVFVDNARDSAEKCGMNSHQFAGGLAALKAKGIYEPSTEPEYKGLYGYFNDK